MKTSRYRRVNRNLILIIIGANFCGAALTSLYFALLAIDVDIQSGLIWGMSGALPPLLMALGGFLRDRYLHPLNQWYRLAIKAEQPPPAPERIRRLALDMPAISAGINMFVWLIGGLFAALLIGFLSPSEQFNWVAFLQTSLGSSIAGFVTAVLIYFAIERVWQLELPLFFTEASLKETSSFRMTVKRRLLVLFGMGLMPLLFLVVASYNRAVQMVAAPQPADLLPGLLRLELFVVGIGIFLAVGLAGTLGTSLAEPLEALNRHMDAVRRGNLNQHMPVRSNDELGMLAEGFNEMVTGLRREEVIRLLFGLYVTPQVADYAIEHGAERGGQLVEATVVFSDIRGFTSLTEQLEPQVLIDLLNRYYQAMSGVVMAHGGLVNKFGGDSLLAVFGTPLNPAEDHALRAVRAAEGFLQALERFNLDQEERTEPKLAIGVGVATGPVVSGNLGSDERLEYTVIGDAVNMASRLEAMTKQVEATILLNQAAALPVQDRVSLSPMGTLRVRGKRELQQVYALKRRP